MKRILSIVAAICTYFILSAGTGVGAPLPAGPSTGFNGVQWRAQWGGAATALVRQNDRAFVAVGPRLLVADLSDPAAPGLSGYSEPLLETIRDVAVTDNYAFVAAGYGGLVIYDVTGASPLKVAQLHTGGYVNEVEKAAGALFVTETGGRLLQVDVSDAGQPVVSDMVDGVGQVTGLASAGGALYLATGYGGVRVFDAQSMVQVNAFAEPAWSVDVVGSFALVGADFSGGLWLYDLTNGGQAEPAGFISTPTFVTAAAGSQDGAPRLYLGLGTHGIQVLDFSNPTQARLLTTVSLGGSSSALAWSDGLLLALDETHGLSLFAPQADDGLQRRGIMETTGPVLAIDLDGSMPLLATRSGDVVVTDGGADAVLSRIPLPAPAQGIARVGSRAIVAAGDAGLVTLDLSDPTQPVQLATVATPGTARQLFIAGDTAYVAAGAAGLLIYDVSSLAAPVPVAAMALPGDAHDVVVRDGIAYVADWAGLQLLDVSDPAQPQLLGHLDTTGYAAAVALDGSRAYVADGQRVDVIDVTDPAQPVKVDQIVTPGMAGDVAIFGSLLAVADGQSGARLYRLDAGAGVVPAGFYDTAGYTAGVAFSGDQLWMADRDGGVTVVTVPESYALFLPLVTG